MQLYAVLRGAIFAESGFNLNLREIVPDGLKKSMNAVFCTLDDAGKTVRIERIVGCEGTQEDMVSIPLTPYADSAKANAALRIICDHLSGVVAGDNEAKSIIGGAWRVLVVDGMCLTALSAKTQLSAVENLFGAGRIHGQLNKFGTLAGLPIPGAGLMVKEAFGQFA